MVIYVFKALKKGYVMCSCGECRKRIHGCHCDNCGIGYEEQDDEFTLITSDDIHGFCSDKCMNEYEETWEEGDPNEPK